MRNGLAVLASPAVPHRVLGFLLSKSSRKGIAELRKDESQRASARSIPVRLAFPPYAESWFGGARECCFRVPLEMDISGVFGSPVN
jgi:hypothetical protein